MSERDGILLPVQSQIDEGTWSTLTSGPIETGLRTTSRIIIGDARAELRSLPAKFFQSCITSPPYWGMRDYGISDQIGAEENLETYVSHLREVFAEVHRVLRDDGTLWLNIGDTYTSGDRGWRAPDRKNPSRTMAYRPPTPQGLKPKDLIGVPWRVAFALQEDGWYLRSDIIWNKPNAQPESVKDRPTRAHEYMFLLSKSEQYYYDYESMREPCNGSPAKRNRRTVWSINTESDHPPHLAVFPPELIRTCVAASSRANDQVLDPFMGSGTVGLVCAESARKFVGIELKPEYAAIAHVRIVGAHQ